MTDKVMPKETSYQYGKDYQAIQVEKYKNRENNHWKYRIKLGHDLVDKYHQLFPSEKSSKDTVVVDVGTSIGTFAIEFSKKGYKTFGVDFDEDALLIAKDLAKEEGVNPEFIKADISNWSEKFPLIDIAICFDIFEHLHDDELGSLLVSIRKNLAPNGCLVFHTFPTQYDYLIFGRPLLRYPLYIFSKFPQKYFVRILRAYAALFDIYLLLFRGLDYRDTIKTWSHCNPLTEVRLTEILKRAGYEINYIATSHLYPGDDGIKSIFRKQKITERNMYGVVTAKKTGGM